MRTPGARAHAALLALALSACASPPDYRPPDRLLYLDQGWSDAQRQIYYYTPQGTELHGVRYDWLRYVELPTSAQRLADPQMLARFGFLYDPAQLEPGYRPPAHNPGNFPVGFASHIDPKSGEALLDVTCAACHTGQLEYQGTALRVDGGQALHAFGSFRPGHFAPTLVLALQATYANPFKFDRFARRVLGVRYPAEKRALRDALGASVAAFVVDAQRAIAKGLYPTEDGPGRVDALDRIANSVFGDDLNPDNYRVANAPVSYPHVWDIWKFDWVQWNGSVAQPMGRNVGEALGVKARVHLIGRDHRPLPPERRYESSVLIKELYCLETTLQALGPPRWNEDVLGKIDVVKAAAGRELFAEHCRGCHGPHVYPHGHQLTRKKPIEWRMTVIPTAEIGTDPRVANNFLDYVFDAGALDPTDPSLRQVDAGAALNVVTKNVIARKYDALGLTRVQRWKFDGFGRTLGVQRIRGYKARPLDGIWATPPYLHNGSVPSLYELLLPEEERSRTFWVGRREFDPVRVGYRTERFDRGFLLDTTLPGNANTGHQFRNDGGAGVIGPGFSDEERFQIIEYVKILGNPAFGEPEDATAPGTNGCTPDLQGPASATTALLGEGYP